jgi:predicted metal-binding protein
MYKTCYKCGSGMDDYPSTMCAGCRAEIQDRQNPEDGIRKLAARLTEMDYRWLKEYFGIRIDDDLRRS